MKPCETEPRTCRAGTIHMPTNEIPGQGWSLKACTRKTSDATLKPCTSVFLNLLSPVITKGAMPPSVGKAAVSGVPMAGVWIVGTT